MGSSPKHSRRDTGHPRKKSNKPEIVRKPFLGNQTTPQQLQLALEQFELPAMPDIPAACGSSHTIRSECCRSTCSTKSKRNNFAGPCPFGSQGSAPQQALTCLAMIPLVLFYVHRCKVLLVRRPRNTRRQHQHWFAQV